MNPPDSRPAVPHELLLEQAGFLRRLARDLVRDPHTAEDALQDTWVAALEHPPRHGGNVRAWLGTILRNLVAKRANSRGRRAQHELQAGREALGSAATGSSGESVRLVTDAVLALEEPYRATILARYFDELSPTEIAERQSVPVATVKSRLRRALEMLRANLERERGSSWANGLIGLAWPAAGVGKGVLVMTLKTKVAAAAAILLGTWFVIHELTAVPERASDPRASTVESPVLAGGGSDPAQPLLVDAPSGSRSANPASLAATAATSADPPPTLFYGSLRDRTGKLLAGLWSAGISLTDSTGRWRSTDAADGTYAFGALPYGKYWVLAGGDGYQSLEDVIELDAEHAQLKRDFTLQQAAMLRIRVTTSEGEPWFDRQHGGVKLPGYPMLLPVATKGRPGRWLDGPAIGSNPNQTYGIGYFANYGPRVEALPTGYYGILMLHEALPAFVSLVCHSSIVQTKEVKAGEEEVEFVVSLDELRGALAEVRLEVVDADSQAPILGDSLQVGPQCQLRREGQRSEVVIGGLGAGDFDWEIRAPGYEQVSVRFHVEPGGSVDLGQIALDKELQVEARVVDATGAPRSDLLDLCSVDPATHSVRLVARGIPSNGEGALKLNCLGRRLYVIRSGDYQLGGERVVTDSILAAGNTLLDLRSGRAPANLTVRLLPVTRLTFTVADPSLKDMPLHVLDEQGLSLFSSIVYGAAPRALALPQGSYRMEILDNAGGVVVSKSVTLGGAPLAVELSR